MPAKIRQRAQNIEAGERVELLEADLTALGGTILRFHNSTTQGAVPITWQGNDYIAYPLKIEGFEYKSQGTLPRPHLFLSNIGSTISGLMRAHRDCIGAKVTRHVTFAEFLDGRPGADPTQEFLPDVFYIERKVSETSLAVEFELASAVDVQGIQLPLRQLQANNCPFLYRSGEGCGYAGPPVQDENGNNLAIAPGATVWSSTITYAANAWVTIGGGWWRSLQSGNLNHTPAFGSTWWSPAGQAWSEATTYIIGDFAYVLVNGIRQYYVSLANGNTSPLTDATKWTRDWCAKTLSACKARFGATNPLDFGAFLGVTKLPRV